MNPDEQDRNPFRRRTSAGSRAGRYLSGRPNFSRQQTPDFFAQAMAQNTPAPTQKNRVNKKPIFITLGVLGIIAFIALTVTVIIPMIGDVIASKDKNHSFPELQQTIAEYRDDVLNMYLTISGATKDSYLWTPLTNPESREQGVKDRSAAIERIKEFKNKLDGFGGVKAYDYFGREVDVDPSLDYIKKKIDIYMTAFEKINNICSLIVDSYKSDGEQSKIDAIRNAYEDEEMDEIADLIEAFYKVYRDYENDEQFKKCMDEENGDFECKMDLSKIEKANRKVMASKSLTNIMSRIANKALEDEEKNNLMNAINEVYNLYNEKVVHE